MSIIASAKEFWDTTTEQNAIQSTDWMVMLAENRSLRRKALSSPGVLAILNGSGATAKAVVGLGSVNNTSDADKPISTLQQTALDAKLDATAINTLAKLNAILADATLIDATDARLSDARTPLSHTHTLSAISDASANGRSLVGAADYAAMRTLLNVESGAAADQTGSEIKALYEAEADTNAFTDALLTKLGAIESGATADQTGSEIKTLYEGEADTNAFTDALLTKLNAIESGATADQSSAEIETAYNAQVGQVSAGEITAGTATGVRRYSPANIKSFIDTHAPVEFPGWSQDGTALIPNVAGYALGKAGNEVGDIFSNGSLSLGGSTNADAPLHIKDSSGGAGGTIHLERFSNSASAAVGLVMGGGRGSIASPAASQNGDRVAYCLAQGRDTDLDTHNSAGINFIVDSAPNSAGVPMRIDFLTGTNSGDRAERITLKSGGNIGIATIDPISKLDVAGDISVKDGVNPRKVDIYNTYTDASNYERGFARWVGNTFEIGTEAAGTGVARPLKISSGSGVLQFTEGNYVISMSATGLSGLKTLTPATGGVSDVGGGTLPWRNIYLRPSSSLTPTANGDLVIEATNNTTLTLKLRGSDGTVRSGTVALA